MISVGGIRSGNSVTNTFSGALRTCAGSLTTSVFGMDALEQMRRGDVGEIERRVLAQQDHVEGRELDAPRLTQRKVVADLIAHRHALHAREHAAADLRQPVRRVVGQGVSARLRFQQQRKGRIAANVDPLDRVHLHGNIQHRFHL